MARVALIKLFSGLNLGTAQLAGMLQSRGHECITVYLKHYFVRPEDDIGANNRKSRYAGVLVGPRARQECWQTFEPFTDIEKDLLVSLLKEYRPDLVGFSLTSSSITDAIELTKLIKNKLGVPVVWGGVGPTIEPEEFVREPGLLCVGEGEHAMLDIAEAIDQGKTSFSDIPNIWGVENGTVFRNEPRPLISNLDELPFPTLDPEHNYYVDNNELVSNIYPPNLRNVYPIMASRGCPYACKYCVNHLFRRMFDGYARVRTRSVSHVMDELVAATKKYDLNRVLFYDDVFAMNRQWVDEFAPRYKREIGLPFWCYVDPRFTKKDILAKLQGAGLDGVEMGMQSGSRRVLNDIYDRRMNPEDVVEAGKILVELGLECLLDIMTYVEGETEEDCRETFDILVDLPKEICFTGFGKLTYYPGYDITLERESMGNGSMTPELYDYYHRLYHLTRTKLPKSVIRFMGSLSLFRHQPRLLDLFLPKDYRLPKFYGKML